MTLLDTCPEINYNIYQEDCVRKTVKHNPTGGEVIVKKGNCHGENNEVRHKKEEHTEIPIESTKVEDDHIETVFFELCTSSKVGTISLYQKIDL